MVYHIVKLEAQNVLRLKAISLEPDGSATIIGGNNGEGKTSTLRCIEMCLSGAGSLPPKPIHGDESKGTIKLKLRKEIEDELDIVRTFTAKGSQLKITRKGGDKVGSPQKLLDTLVGNLSFDPLSFAAGSTPEDERRRARIVSELAGLDFTFLNDKRKKYYDRRTQVGRDLDTANTKLKDALHHMDAPEKAISVSELMEELSKAQEVGQANNKLREEVLIRSNEVAGFDQQIKTVGDQLKELKAKMDTLTAARGRAAVKEIEAKAAAEGVEEIDIQPIKDKIAGAEAINDKVRENETYQTLKAESDEFQASWDKLTGIIDATDKQKETELKEAAMPVKGLGLDDTGVTFNGIPFEQCSDAEKLRISMALWMFGRQL